MTVHPMRALAVVGLIGALIVGGSVAPHSAGAAAATGQMTEAHAGHAPHIDGSASVLVPACGQCGGPSGNLSNELFGVSCTDTADCVAVGVHSEASGKTLALVESWNGSTWSIVPNPSPGDTYSALRGVSCTSSTSCVAAGYAGDTSGQTLTLVESWDGSTWSIVPSPSPMSISELSSVSCTSSTNCVAVGSTGDGTAQLTLVEFWDGAVWSVVPSPSPTSVGSSLRGVSCTSSANCVAVGSYNFDMAYPQRTLIESWNGSIWSVVPSPSPLGIARLNSVSCIGSANCTAVGNQQSTGGSEPNTLNEYWNGSTWTVEPSPFNNFGSFVQAIVNVAYGVSCASPAQCLAVGNLMLSSISEPAVSFPMVESWDGNSWTGLNGPTPDNAGATYATVLNGVSCLTSSNCVAVGSYSNASGTQTLIASWNGSEWRVIPSPNVRSLVPPAVAMTAMPPESGYWIADSAGDVTTHGAAINHGSTIGQQLNAPIVQIVATTDGGGYWLVAADGGVFTFGDAKFFGSAGNVHLNAAVVGMALTPTGKGYWLVAADGGVFSFGDAKFSGSMGGKHINQPVVGVATDIATGGYWLVAADGGAFNFDAPFYGSMGAVVLNKPVVSIAPTSDGGGYWFTASDGGVFAFGDAVFQGSMGGKTMNEPVVGIAADTASGGYWLVAADGGIFSFGAPFYGAG